MRLKTDTTLRKALYGLYIALFKANQKYPNVFSDQRLTKILTAVMSIENEGWRVIGITKEALDSLAKKNFDKEKLPPRNLCRGHKKDRIKTTRNLLNIEKPMKLDVFYKVYLRNDQTVIMLNDQNKKPFPKKFIKIDNPDAELFPNGSIGWKHRKKEREFLQHLHSSLSVGGSLRNKTLR